MNEWIQSTLALTCTCRQYRRSAVTSDPQDLLKCYFILCEDECEVFLFVPIQHCLLVVPWPPCSASQLSPPAKGYRKGFGNIATTNCYRIWVDLWTWLLRWAISNEAFISLVFPFQKNCVLHKSVMYCGSSILSQGALGKDNDPQKKI